MGFRGRKSRTQRKHFVQSRENNWKNSSENVGSDEQQQNAATTDNRENSNPTWKRFATQNLAFDEYYKVYCLFSNFIVRLYLT